jgi:glycosyltransferase involved in cell wall biosynthesis
MPQNEMLLSVVIPIFNEEPTIGDVIGRLKTTMQKIGFKHEIIVVDDCSEDRSLEISKSASIMVFADIQKLA